MKKEEKLVEFKTHFADLYFREHSDSKLIQMMNDDLKGFMSSDTMAIYSLIGKDSVCVDVGANIGALTCAMARKAKKVYAVEPVKSTVEILKKNILNNQLTNVEILECGMGDIETEMMVSGDEVSSSAYLVENKKNNVENSEFVKVVKFDNVITEKIDFVKIDVQGMDTLVVKGAEKTIKEYKPIFFIEYWAANNKIGRAELKAYKKMFEGYNFYINIKKDFTIGRRDFLMAKLPSIYTMLFSTGTQDFYAIPKEKYVPHVNSLYLISFLFIKKIKTKLELIIYNSFSKSKI